MSLKVAYIQCELAWENESENLENFDNWLKQVEPNTDLIVLPEMFTTGFSMEPEHLAVSMNGKAVSWMIQKSNSLNAHIAGSLIIKENNKYYNRFVVTTPKGEVYTYNKKHLFRYANEHLNYTTSGTELILPINDFKIAFYICYDLRFPVWSRNTNLKYDLGIYVANWPEKRKDHWLTLLKARAIENQSYILGVNRIGTDGNNVEYSGNSILYNFKGETISIANEKELAITTCILNKDELNEYRVKFPAHLDADKFEIL